MRHRAELVQQIGQSRLPAIYMETGFVAAGGLISYGPNLSDIIRRSADYLDKILKGAKAGDLRAVRGTPQDTDPTRPVRL